MRNSENSQRNAGVAPAHVLLRLLRPRLVAVDVPLKPKRKLEIGKVLAALEGVAPKLELAMLLARTNPARS